MKKILFSIAVVFSLFTGFVSAAEWGGVVNNETRVTSPDFKSFPFYQSNSIYMWLNAPLTADASWKFAGEALYKYELNAPSSDESKKVDFSNIVDVDLVKLSGNIALGSNNLSVNAGRFLMSDGTGSIFTQTSDGLQLSFGMPNFTGSVYGGYTGLVNSKNVTMVNENGVAYSAANDFYSLSHKYVPVILTVNIPSVFANQSLGIEGSGYFDLEATKENEDGTKDEQKNAYYGTLTISGPIVGSVYYTILTSFGSFDFTNVMNFSTVSVQAFPMDGISVSGGVKYASGKQGFLSDFRTITSQTAYNSLLGPQLSGVILPNGSFTIAGSNYFVNVAAMGVLALPETTVSFEGFEVDLSAVYNVFSDLSLSADINVYQDLSADRKDASESNYKATIKAAISF